MVGLAHPLVRRVYTVLGRNRSWTACPCGGPRSGSSFSAPRCQVESSNLPTIFMAYPPVPFFLDRFLRTRQSCPALPWSQARIPPRHIPSKSWRSALGRNYLLHHRSSFSAFVNARPRAPLLMVARLGPNHLSLLAPRSRGPIGE